MRWFTDTDVDAETVRNRDWLQITFRTIGYRCTGTVRSSIITDILFFYFTIISVELAHHDLDAFSGRQGTISGEGAMLTLILLVTRNLLPCFDSGNLGVLCQVYPLFFDRRSVNDLAFRVRKNITQITSFNCVLLIKDL